MKRLIRKIINWAYGYDFVLGLHFLEERQMNLSIILHDHIMTTATGRNVQIKEVAISPDTATDDQ